MPWVGAVSTVPNLLRFADWVIAPRTTSNARTTISAGDV